MQKMGIDPLHRCFELLPEHMERLEKETGVLPSINQVELHPFFNQKQQRQWHDEHGVATESWSPLARTNDVFSNDTIKLVADKHNKTASQVILRWHYQLGSVPIPKSASPNDNWKTCQSLILIWIMMIWWHSTN